MELSDIAHWFFGGSTELLELFHNNFDPVKAVTILFAALTTLFGVYIKWRNSGYRQLTRLEEFLKDQRSKLSTTRDEIGQAFDVPSPVRPVGQPVFCEKTLKRTIHKSNWGFGQAALNNPAEAVLVSAEQEKAALTQQQEFRERKALAHLVLGAKAAAKNPTSHQEKLATRCEALSEFDKALEINPDDDDAMEYAAMMLLELSNPEGALDRLRELLKLREAKSGYPLAKVHLLSALAFQQLPNPRYGNANDAYSSAIRLMPPERQLELAAAHEQQAKVRVALNFLPSANRNCQIALGLYRQLRSTPEGRKGLDRVTEALAQLNKMPTNGTADGGTPIPPHETVITRAPGFMRMFTN